MNQNRVNRREQLMMLIGLLVVVATSLSPFTAQSTGLTLVLVTLSVAVVLSIRAFYPWTVTRIVGVPLALVAFAAVASLLINRTLTRLALDPRSGQIADAQAGDADGQPVRVVPSGSDASPAPDVTDADNKIIDAILKKLSSTESQTLGPAGAGRRLAAVVLPLQQADDGVRIRVVLRNDGRLPERISRANLIVAATEELDGMIFGPLIIGSTTLQPGESRVIVKDLQVTSRRLRDSIPGLPFGRLQLPVAVAFQTIDPSGMWIDHQVVCDELQVGEERVMPTTRSYVGANLLEDSGVLAVRRRSKSAA